MRNHRSAVLTGLLALFASLLVVARAHAQAPSPPRMGIFSGSGSIRIDGFDCPGPKSQTLQLGCPPATVSCTDSTRDIRATASLQTSPTVLGCNSALLTGAVSQVHAQITLTVQESNGSQGESFADMGFSIQSFEDCSVNKTITLNSASIQTTGDATIQRSLLRIDQGVGSDIRRFCKGTDCSALGGEQNTLVTSGADIPLAFAISAALKAFADMGGTATITLDLTIDLSRGTDCPPSPFIRWINGAGGAFTTDTNWDPQQVPASGDTAIFDLPIDSPVVITATNNEVARMVIRRMNVALLGPVQALGIANNFSFEVDDGGTLTLGNGVPFQTSNAVVGKSFGTESSVFVGGAGTQWSSTASDQLLIGSGAPGKVVVDQNGALASNNDINVGAQAAGTFKVESGGQVITPNCTLSKGSIQVRGIGVKSSNIDIASNLNVGATKGAASLVIENSGTVEATQAFIGDALSTGAAAVTISDANGQGGQAKLTTDGTGTTFQVAGSAGAQVEVKDGGVLNTAADAQIGASPGAGKVLVHGKHDTLAAKWIVARKLSIGGKNAASELAISDGGLVTAPQLTVGENPDEIGSVTVSGKESQLLPDTILVGRDGKGSLEITDGANVVGRSANVGVSHLAEGQANPPTSGGMGQGSVTIGDNTLADSKWHLSQDCFVGLDEPGTITLKGLTAGPVNLGGATLEVGGQVEIALQGAIMGSGKLCAGSRAVNGGTLSPGLSPGTITIEGNYEQKPEGVLKIEIAGLDEGQFDVLNVTGDATLGGTVEVHFLNGFLLKAGDSVDFMPVGGNVSGDFSQITFPELAAGFDADLSLTSDGKLRLTARTDAVAGSGTSLTPPADLTTQSSAPVTTVCGAGACGAGLTLLLPLTAIALSHMRRGCRTRGTY